MFWTLEYKTVPSNDSLVVCTNCGVEKNMLIQNSSCLPHLIISRNCHGNKTNRCIMHLSEGYSENKLYEFRLTRCHCDHSQSWNYKIATNDSIAKLNLESLEQNGSVYNTSAKFRIKMMQSYYEACGNSYVIVCDVSYTSEWNSKSETIHISHSCSEEYEDNGVYIEMHNLQPYTNYTVDVTCKNEGSLYWSNKIQTTFQTLSVLPLDGPLIQNGAYSFYRCYNDLQCLVLYWKSPDHYLIRGQLLGYNVTISSVDILYNAVQTWNFNVTSDPETAFLNVPIYNYMDYKVEVYTVNDQGFSLQPSTIVIPSRDKIKYQPSCVRYKRNDTTGSYLLSYETLVDTHDTQLKVTYYWCLGKIIPENIVICETNFNWTMSRNQSVWINPHIDKEYDSHHMYFAVSLSLHNVSSELQWNVCSDLSKVAKDLENNSEEIVIGVIIGCAMCIAIITITWCCIRQAKKMKSYDPKIDVPQIKEHYYTQNEGVYYSPDHSVDDTDTTGYGTASPENSTSTGLCPKANSDMNSKTTPIEGMSTTDQLAKQPVLEKHKYVNGNVFKGEIIFKMDKRAPIRAHDGFINENIRKDSSGFLDRKLNFSPNSNTIRSQDINKEDENTSHSVDSYTKVHIVTSGVNESMPSPDGDACFRTVVISTNILNSNSEPRNTTSNSNETNDDSETEIVGYSRYGIAFHTSTGSSSSGSDDESFSG